MKKILQITILCTLLLGLVSSCGPDDILPADETLNAPAGLQAGTITATTAELSWTAVAGAEKYEVSIDDAAPAEVAGASYKADNLTPKTTYTWKVRAVKGSVKSEWSSSSDFITQSTTLSAPTDLVAIDVTHYSATLTWRHDSAESYEVVFNNGALVTVDKLDYDVTGLTPQTTYTWKVRSGKDGALSEWAEGGEFTTASAPDTPAPTALAAVDVIDKAAKLTWQHVDADSHEVIVGDGDAVTVTGTGYDVSGLTPQTTYTWKVRSCKYGVWSEWVEGDEFTTGVLQFLGAGTVSWYDTQYGEDTQNYQIIFIDYDPGKGNPDKGISMKLDVCFSRAELGVDSGRRALDFPNATYTVTDNTVNPAINTILAFYCDVNVYEGHVPTRKGIKSGSMTVTGNYVDGYHMTFDFVLEDDSVIIAEYNGQFVINNPKL